MFGIERVDALLSRSKSTEAHVYAFLDQLTAVQHEFVKLWRSYIEKGADSDDFCAALQRIHEIEHRADELNREIETTLYLKTLIPDLRSDLASLIELMDGIINLNDTVSSHLNIERPIVPAVINEDFFMALATLGDTIDHTVLCARSFLSDLQRVQEYHTKVMLLENDTAALCNKIKTTLFQSDLQLVEKIHLRYFVDRIQQIAELAEDVSDRISIYTLKRMQ